MPLHECRCMIIPPYVLENMAKLGDEQARLSIQQDLQSRNARKNTVISLAALTTIEAVGQADRRVYDCHHRWSTDDAELARAEGENPASDEAVNDAYNGAGAVRTYYKEKLNRNSIDNRGMDLLLYTNYGVNYMNAFWDGKKMVFGDGDGQIFIDFTKSLDVIGHELAHGVTQYTANLEYRSQSGALNEHFSDVFGSAIKQSHKGQNAHNADWLIGDEIMGPTLYGEALRSMKAPGTAYNNSMMGKDPQPDHMDKYYSGPADNQGVHINSGIPNKVFYLVSMDIGTDKAALIWYTALQKLWATAVFNDAVEVLVSAAQLLTRDGIVPRGSTQIVRSAFKSVGLPR